jgi:hypothetical protein
MLEKMGISVLANYSNLRVNTDNITAMDFEFETVYDPKFVIDVDAITDAIDELTGGNDDSGEDKGGSQDTVELAFNLPDDPQITYNDSTGTITVTDEDGNEQTIELPKDEDGNIEFPVTIVDGAGDTYIVTKDGNGNVHIEKQEQLEELGDVADDESFSCGCPDDVIQSVGNGDCKYIYEQLQKIRNAHYEGKQVTLHKTELKNGRLSIIVDDSSSVCIENLYYDMSFIQKDKINISVDTYQITKTTTNSMFGGNSSFWTIRLDNSILIKISETEANSENKIKALTKWLFDKNMDSGIILDKNETWWISQCNSLFSGETCWNSECLSNKCCNKAANKILENAGTSTNRSQQIIIAESDNSDCSELTGKSDKFNEAIQIVDKSLKEHSLPIMIGVHHPKKKEDKNTGVVTWDHDCSGNTPSITNHYIVVRGKRYDNAKKQYYYLFYEVGTGNTSNGKSLNNRMYINEQNYLMEGKTTSQSSYTGNYYIVTEVRKNIGQTY